MHLRGISYAFAASLLFGLGAVLAKLSGAEIDATMVALLNLAGGGLLLTALLAFRRTSLLYVLPALKRGDLLNLFLLACPGTALPLLFVVAGFARTSALQGGFILQLSGVAAVLFAVVLLKERFRLKQGLGILLLLCGSALVVFKGPQAMAWGSGGLGDLLILTGAVGLGFGFVPAKRLTGRIDTLPLTALRLLVGACTLLPVLAVQLIVGAHALLWRPSFALVGILLIYMLTNFCLAYLSQQEGLRFLKAWEVASILQTVPLFSTLFAVLLLHDSITLLQVGGGLLALLGGLVVSLSNQAQAATEAEVRSLEEAAEGGRT